MNQELPMLIYDRYHHMAMMAIEYFGGDDKRGIVINLHTYCDENVDWTALGKWVLLVSVDQSSKRDFLSQLDLIASIPDPSILTPHSYKSALV